MSCSEYAFLERAHSQAIEEVNRLRLFSHTPRTASSLDELVGAEVTKSIIDAARTRHLHDCGTCIKERWHAGPAEQQLRCA